MSGDDHKELARFVSHLAMLALHLDSGNLFFIIFVRSQ